MVLTVISEISASVSVMRSGGTGSVELDAGDEEGASEEVPQPMLVASSRASPAIQKREGVKAIMAVGIQ
jgi:hypothetical protein